MNCEFRDFKGPVLCTHVFLCPRGGKTRQFSTRYDRKTLKLCCHDNESQTASTNQRGWLHTVVGCSCDARNCGPHIVMQIVGDTFVTKKKKKMTPEAFKYLQRVCFWVNKSRCTETLPLFCSHKQVSI